MKTFFVTVWLVLAAVGALVAAPAKPARVTESFDANWRFLKADFPGAEQPQFDDSAWRTLDVPHDWSIEGPFSETNRTGGSGGFLPGGVGWYRKDFTLPDAFSNQCVFIEFDGVMQNSEVWINGVSLGKRPYGYVSFSYELTGHLNFGAGRTNVLAVRADTSEQPASRWYSGAGIYRHVRLVTAGPVHVEQWGAFVSTPQISAGEATVHVQTVVTNEFNAAREVSLAIILLDPAGKIVARAETKPQTIAPGTSVSIGQNLAVKNPQRWDLDSPVLYRAQVRVDSGGVPFDEDTVAFGIREFHFDADTGFWLNGRNFKIKGACLHHDGGAFGAAVPLGIWEDRLKTLKSLGVNAIRTAHNPPAPEFLDLCDRMGFLVMDELFDCWTVAKPTLDEQPLADYHLYFNDWSKTDERDTLRRDRNHPGIILYSVGNEIHDTPKAELAKGILKGLVEVAHETDPTRPVTQALFRPNVSHDYDDGLADLLDVIGQNYRENEILAAHQQKSSRKIIGTENRQDLAAWLALRDNAPYAGQFLWSGVDYLGESRRWPVICSGSGMLDRTGALKPPAVERRSWWSGTPMVSLARRAVAANSNPDNAGANAADRRPQTSFADWTPMNSAPHEETVEVYSNCGEVELFLNGKSLGVKPLKDDALTRIWKVAYAPGTLKAVGRSNGRRFTVFVTPEHSRGTLKAVSGDNGCVVATDELLTAGRPAKIVLTTGPGRLPFDWDAVACVRATVVDAHNIAVPGADDLISFKLSGPGMIAAVDNANHASHEPFQAGERHAFQGRCVAFVKAAAPAGKIILTASAAGLQSDSITLKAIPPAAK